MIPLSLKEASKRSAPEEVRRGVQEYLKGRSVRLERKLCVVLYAEYNGLTLMTVERVGPRGNVKTWKPRWTRH